MKKLFVLLAATATIAISTSSLLAVDAVIQWSGGGSSTDGWYNFNDGANWNGGVAPDSSDSIFLNNLGSVNRIEFTAATTLSANENTAPNGVVSCFESGGGSDFYFSGQSLTVVTSPVNGTLARIGANRSFIFLNDVIFQTHINTFGGAFNIHAGNFEHYFERVLIKRSADNLGGSIIEITGGGNGRVYINELADFATGSTGRLEVNDYVKLNNSDNFTGILSVSGTLMLFKDVGASVDFRARNGCTILLNENVDLHHSISNLGGWGGGYLTLGSSVGFSTVSATININQGGNNEVRFRAVDEDCTLRFTGSLEVHQGDRALNVDGNGQVYFDGAEFKTWSYTLTVGSVTPGASQVILGGNTKFSGPAIVYNGAGLANYSMGATGNIIPWAMTFDNAVDGLDISAMATDEKLWFYLDAPEVANTPIKASLLTMGYLGANEFKFSFGANFGEGTYTLFLSEAEIDGTLDTTSVFALGAAYQGSLAWGANNESILLSVAAIPEPATLVLLGLALGMGALFRRKKLS